MSADRGREHDVLENKDKGDEAEPWVITSLTDEEHAAYACPLYCEN